MTFRCQLSCYFELSTFSLPSSSGFILTPSAKQLTLSKKMKKWVSYIYWQTAGNKWDEGKPTQPQMEAGEMTASMDRWGNSTANQIFPSMGAILCVPYLATSDLCSFLTERVKFLSSKAYEKKKPWKPLKSIMKKNKDKVEVCEVQDLLEQSNNWSILLYRCVCVYIYLV